MAGVKERVFDGSSFSDDFRPWEVAQALTEKKLDRRLNYLILHGIVCRRVSYTETCFGCSDDQSNSTKGSGCSCCGFSGRSRHTEYNPI